MLLVVGSGRLLGLSAADDDQGLGAEIAGAARLLHGWWQVVERFELSLDTAQDLWREGHHDLGRRSHEHADDRYPWAR